MNKIVPIVAVAAAFGIVSGAASTSAPASQETTSRNMIVNGEGMKLAFTLDEMNCFSSDLQVTNSMPCSKKGTNWGKPSGKKSKPK